MSPTEKQEEKTQSSGLIFRYNRCFQRSDKIEVIQGIVKDPFVGKYCTNAEIQCDSLDTKKAAEAILTTYYYRVPLDVEPSIGETCDLYTRLPER